MVSFVLVFFGTAGVACCVPFGFGELGLGRHGELSWVSFRLVVAGEVSCGPSWYVQLGCGLAGLVRLDWVRSGLVT